MQHHSGHDGSPAPRSPFPVTPATTPARPAQPQAAPPAPEVDQAAYDQLARDVRALLGLDLGQYKKAQVWRRVNGFASTRGFADTATLIAACRTDSALRAAFRDMITINVSEFFRNSEVWQTLATRFLAPALRGQALTRVWSAGCSFGFEAYSIAMLARELVPMSTVRVLATDVDETILVAARASRYAAHQMVGVSDARRARFFRRDGDAWEVRPEIRALVTFRRHDLLRDPFEAGFDLVACRNVVIYFTEAAKDVLYRKLAGALRPGGILFVGATEAVPSPSQFGLETMLSGFYRRADA